MRTTLTAALTVVLTAGVLAAAALAQGGGHGPPPHSQAPHADRAEISVLQGAHTAHADASAPYVAAAVVDTVTFGEGDWKVTATGAVNLTGDPVALNCGLRVADQDSATGFTMIAKQNPAVGGETGRVGFSVVGGIEVGGGDVDVELVCYGGGNLPFEHNLVAIGG